MIDPHVLCLTDGNEEVPAHWALYGRGGRGVALKFKGAGIKALADTKDLGLAKVLYNVKEQQQVMATAVQRFLAEAMGVRDYAVAKHGPRHAAMYLIAAHAFGGMLTGIAATMKKHGYSIENEWRLLNAGVEHCHGVDVADDLMRSYFDYEFDPNSLEEIILGPVLATVNAPVIGKLLSKHGLDHVKISVADVSFRAIK